VYRATADVGSAPQACAGEAATLRPGWRQLPLIGVLRCRVCWVVTVAVFVSIVAIEVAIFVPSYGAFEEERLRGIESSARQALTSTLAALEPERPPGGLPQAGRLERALANTAIRGAVLEGAGGARLVFGERPPASSAPVQSLRLRRQRGDPHRFWASWPIETPGGDFHARAVLSAGNLEPELQAFAWRIAGLVLLIGAFVTLVTMLVLQYLVLGPVVHLRDRMQGLGEAPQRPRDFRLHSGRRDELGAVFRAFNGMLEVSHRNLERLAEREARYRELNAALDQRVAARTRDLEQANARLAYRATHDELTGLTNRGRFADRVERALAAGRDAHPPAVLMLGLEGFGALNGVHGYRAGDRLLRRMAQGLRAALPRSAEAARFRGAVFAVLLPDASARDVDALAMRCRAELQRAAGPDGPTLRCDARVGYALANGRAGSAEELIGQAEVALGAALQPRERPVQRFTAAMGRALEHRLGRIESIRGGIERGEFIIHFQPQHRVGQGMTAVETLVRWQHPEEGLLGPAEFVPLAEENGLIGQLGALVLEQALAQAAAWRAEGRPLRVAVNLSALELHSPELPDRVAAALARHALPGESLELEITESAVLEDVDTGSRALERLRALGVQLAVDDFGTGYSSLAYLSRLPVDRLKIDRAFIHRLPGSRRDAALCRTIIELARRLDLQVVAEGVENPAQADWLEAHGCPDMQGFHFGRPVAAAVLDPYY